MHQALLYHISFDHVDQIFSWEEIPIFQKSAAKYSFPRGNEHKWKIYFEKMESKIKWKIKKIRETALTLSEDLDKI